MSPVEPRRPGRARLSREEALRIAASRGAESGFFFDFDGVLSPIQNDPATSQPVPGVLNALAQLAERSPRVGIVSARQVEFLLTRVGEVPGLALYGLYGLEHAVVGGEITMNAEAVSWIPAMEELVRDALAELPDTVKVEDKRLSVALHYRTAPELRGTVERWARQKASSLGLGSQTGRMVVELKPPVDRHKGTVLREEVSGLAAAWFFGDDVADILAFRTLMEMEAENPEFIGVRVAVANEETGAAVAEAADFTIDSPRDLVSFIEEIVARLN
ncbi:trehalose-phosphatase [Rhizohabitans arisaemae]|uniref:trehalose-phosphatase n=1 Tax=Rhizohabitans arisaemae TaxID=2720610 RepID=UPI0024B08520|nr:trehalose-phosphatase [Rhizohabitans arisaemae]